MRAGWHLGLVCLASTIVGCAGDGGQDAFAFRNPFRTERGFDPAKAPTASTQAATRVHAVGNDVLAKNGGDFRDKPAFLTVGLKDPMIFHRSSRGVDSVIISEGLVDRCATDAELAAAICYELGKISSEKTESGNSRGDRDLPYSPRLTSDVVGNGSSADMTRQAEEGFNDRRTPRPASRSKEPKANPKTLAQNFLIKAGFTSEDLDKMEPLLKDSEDNADKRDILRGR
ncbi:MAG: hypothetical protein EXS09_16720 [Gemmataceae bacterium]|nr:hypothetical protein [Gemmataceae bacterium]